MPIKLIGEHGFSLEVFFVKTLNSDLNNHWNRYFIKVANLNFIGNYHTNITHEEIFNLINILSEFNNTQKIDFQTMEEGISINAHLDITGNTYCKLRCKDDSGNTLSCDFTIDYLSLEKFVNSLNECNA